jgi:hypothetical protein
MVILKLYFIIITIINLADSIAATVITTIFDLPHSIKDSKFYSNYFKSKFNSIKLKYY